MQALRADDARVADQLIGARAAKADVLQRCGEAGLRLRAKVVKLNELDARVVLVRLLTCPRNVQPFEWVEAL